MGDNDGDDFGVSGDPLLVEMFAEHSVHVFEPGELFAIEGTKERGIRSKALIEDSKVGLGRDFRGPIGIQTNIQLAGLALGKESVILGLMRPMQFSVDQAKKDLPNPDYRIDANRDTWVKVDIPGWPGYKAYKPTDSMLDSDMEDGRGYPDIQKLMNWVKSQLGCKLGDAMPWNRKAKKLTLKDLTRDPIMPEASIVDKVYNHFLTLVKDLGVDLEAKGEAIIGKQLLKLLEWKADYCESVTAVDPESQYYRDLLKRSGLKKYGSQLNQVLNMFKNPDAEEARDRNRQLAAAKEQLVSSLSELTLEERLTIWLTDCENDNIVRAYRVVFLGDNEITRLLGLDDFGGCTFMKDNHEKLIQIVKEVQLCPFGDFGLHRFGDAGAAVLAGYEFYRQGDEIIERPSEETLNSRHEELFGAPLLDCDVCLRSARRLLVNEFRWTPPGDRGEYAIGKVKEINQLLSNPVVQELIHQVLVPHYKEDYKQ